VIRVLQCASCQRGDELGGQACTFIASRCASSDIRKELIDLDLDVPRDLAHERRSDVAALMEWDGRAPAVRMTELLVRASLADFDEPKPRQSADWWGFSGGTEGISGHLDVRCTYELRLELRLSVFKEHRDDFAQVGLQLVQRSTLGVRAGPPWDVADENSCRRVLFNHCREVPHGG
jgi:hypothetical protein